MTEFIGCFSLKGERNGQNGLFYKCKFIEETENKFQVGWELGRSHWQFSQLLIFPGLMPLVCQEEIGIKKKLEMCE